MKKLIPVLALVLAACSDSPESVTEPDEPPDDPPADSEPLYMLMHAGQSLAVGGGAKSYVSRPEDAVVTDVPPCPEHCLMFNTGARGREWRALDPETLTSFLPLHEEFDGIRVGETPGSGIAHMIHTIELDSSFPAQTYLYRSHGAGGASLAEIMQGSTPYDNALKEVEAAVRLSEAPVNVEAVFITHGESDRNHDNQNYKLELQMLLDAYREDIPAITGQSNDPLFFLDQLAGESQSGHKILTDQLELADSTGVYLTGPKYQYDYIDGVHLTAESYRKLGELHGYVYSRVMQGVDWTPLKPLDIKLAGNVVTIRFHVPTPPLVLEAPHGFEVTSEDRSVSINEASVSGDTVTLNLAESPSRATVSYAWNNGGGLHDSMRLHSPLLGDYQRNWAVAFSTTVTRQ